VSDFQQALTRFVLGRLAARFAEDRPDLADAVTVVGGEVMIRAVALPQFTLWLIAHGLGDAADFAQSLDTVEAVRRRVHAEHLLATVDADPTP